MPNAQAKRYWIEQVLDGMLHPPKKPMILEKMDNTLNELWMGRLDSTAMEFYKWLESKKRELEDYVHSDDVQSK